VAVKRLHRNVPEAFENESTILRKLSSRHHDHSHLITLLATFEQHGYKYLMFPWAECDLENYWKRGDHEKDERFTLWLVRQCQGITEAISRIHRYNTTSGTSILYRKFNETSAIESVAARPRTHDPPRQRHPLTLSGRHGDIRPQNILWYHDPYVAQDLGTLKLSDFSSARFRDITNMPEDRSDNSSAMSSTRYISPECRMPEANPSVQCDVWALGCVFLEFICWYHAGYDGLMKFKEHCAIGHDSDSFFTILRSGIIKDRMMLEGKIDGRNQCYAQLKEAVIEVSTSIAVTIGW
jgi:serine/threonine protein kinase